MRGLRKREANFFGRLTLFCACMQAKWLEFAQLAGDAFN